VPGETKINSPQDREGFALARLKPPKSGFQHLGRINRLKLAAHHVLDP